MSYEAGTAFVQIVPSFSGMVSALEEQADGWGQKAGETFNAALEGKTADAKVGPDDGSAESQGESAGGKWADGFTSRVDAALKALPDATVNLDDEEAEAKLDDIRARLETLRGVTIGVDISEADALSAIEILKGECDELARKSPSIQVKVDAGQASTELAAIGTEADAVGAESDSASGGLAALTDGLDGASFAAPALIGALVALATALIPIGGLAAGALATLPAAMAGLGSGLAALKIGFSGISGAVQAYQQQQTKAAEATTTASQTAATAAEQALSNAETERNAANSVAQAREALATAEQQSAQKIANAQTALATAEQQSDQKIANAQTALAAAQQSAANSVHSAEEELTSSEQSLAQAQYNEQQAQVALTAARQDAANQLVNLNDQVADGALAIRQAQIDLTTAQQALNAAMVTPTVTAQQLAQDQLTYETAKQHLQDLQDQQAQLVTQQKQAAAAGVTGSQQVTSAQHQLTQAIQAVGTAQQAVADKTTALSQAQATAVTKVTAAQQALTTAQLSGARSVAQAQQALTTAERSGWLAVANASSALTQALANQAASLQEIALQADGGGSGGGATGAVNTFAAAMSQLSPAAQAFVTYLTGTVMPQYNVFKAQVQQALLPGITTALEALEPVFQTIEPYIIGAASGIGTLAQRLAAFLSSGPGLSALNALFSAGAGFMHDMGTAALTLFKAIVTGGAQAAPLLGTIGKIIDHLATSFAHWVSDAGLQKFLTWVKKNGPAIASDIGKVVKSVGDLVVALAPFGGGVLTVATYLVEFVSWLAQCPALLGAVAIAVGALGVALFIAMDDNPIGLLITAIGLLVIGIIELVTNWTKVWSEIKTIFDQATAFLRSGFGTLVLLITGPFAPLLLLALHWQQVWTGIKTAATVVWHFLDGDIFQPLTRFFTVTVPNALAAVPGFFSSAWNDIKNDAGAAWNWLWNNVLGPIDTFFTATVPSALDSAVGFFAGLPGRIGSGLSSLWNTITGAFGNLGSWVTTHVIQPVVGFFERLPTDLGTALGSIGSAIEDAFKAAFNFVAQAWNTTVGKLNFTIPSWVPGIGGDHFGVPQMPEFRATGGPVMAGSSYIVGEKGPELFVPSAPGMIVPSDDLTSGRSLGTFSPALAIAQLTAQDRALLRAVAGRPVQLTLDSRVLASSVATQRRWSLQHGSPDWR